MNADNIAYQETLDYLYHFVDYSMVRNLRYTPEKFDLQRMEGFMERLGNPQRRYPVIHVAGTKGKGSTAAMIASALRASGKRVGFYTSPHLQDFTERFQIDGVVIGANALVELVQSMRPTIEQTPSITWFEITTALAFLWFAQQTVDVAVVEVGLGGRLDATNIVDPLLSVITSLSMDHMNILGDTLEKIAFEKGGIIKPGKPVVSAPQRAEAAAVLSDLAAARQSPLVRAEEAVHWQSLHHDLDGQVIRLEPREGFPLEVRLPLLGAHQMENAATAFMALRQANRYGLTVSDAQIQQGFAQVVWPARFEVLHRDPVLVVDSAHNRDSARRLRETLEDYLPGRSIILIFGASDDKDHSGMFEELMPCVREVIATESVHPRALAAEKIVALAQSFNKPAQAFVPVEQAVEVACARADSNTAIVAAGSLFIAAAVREVWQQREASATQNKDG